MAPAGSALLLPGITRESPWLPARHRQPGSLPPRSPPPPPQAQQRGDGRLVNRRRAQHPFPLQFSEEECSTAQLRQPRGFLCSLGDTRHPPAGTQDRQLCWPRHSLRAIAQPSRELSKLPRAAAEDPVLMRATSLACSPGEGAHPGRARSDIRSLLPAAGEHDQGQGASLALARLFSSRSWQ